VTEQLVHRHGIHTVISSRYASLDIEARGNTQVLEEKPRF